MSVNSSIVKSVRNGECILFLGAMASAAAPPEDSEFRCDNLPPSGGDLSEKLADACAYPHNDRTNLQRVSLFYECQPNKSRSDLVDAITAHVAAPTFEPSPALRMLAELPFRIIITTNYDQLFEQALYSAKTIGGLSKRPKISIYDPNRNSPEKISLDPAEEQPVLLKLHGDITRRESIVVTEEDYITFILRMGDQHLHPIPFAIRSRMMQWPTLFIGYSLKDYNLRLLFKTLRWQVDTADYPLSFSVDPYPDNLIVAVWQNRPEPMVSFIQQDLWDFVPKLHKEVLG